MNDGLDHVDFELASTFYYLLLQLSNGLGYGHLYFEIENQMFERSQGFIDGDRVHEVGDRVDVLLFIDDRLQDESVVLRVLLLVDFLLAKAKSAIVNHLLHELNQDLLHGLDEVVSVRFEQVLGESYDLVSVLAIRP